MLTTNTQILSKPAVLRNYPYVDGAGNRGQIVRLRFVCGHEEESFRLNLGTGWKPMSDRQLTNQELMSSCPIGYRYCAACSQGTAA